MIIHEIGDLLACDFIVRCHQVNCKGVMGSGVAKQIKVGYPEAFNTYRSTCRGTPSSKLLGTVQFIPCPDGTIVANMFGQNEYANDNRLHTNYNALESCISRVRDFAEWEHLSVAFPYGLGCVRGGGSWEIVEGIINKYFSDSPIECGIIKLK